MAKQIDEWTKTAARYRSEPEAAGGKGEGTVELSRRAIEEQHHRDDVSRQVPSLRVRVGGLPDRHRAGVVDRHHRHGRAELSGRRPRRARACLHGDRAVRAARCCICTERWPSARAARMRRRMRHNSRSARPARFGRNMRSNRLDPLLDRIDQVVRPVEPHQHVLVEPAEPADLQQLRPRRLEHEGGDADDRRAWPSTSTRWRRSNACAPAATGRAA